MKESRIVFVRRKELTNQLPGSRDQDSIFKIGSSLKGLKPLSPFSSTEEKYYLSQLIDMQPEDRDWRKAVTTYWANISKVVPNTPQGLKLEVGVELDSNEEPVEEMYNGVKMVIPLNLADYIIHRYCLVYGRVANTLKEQNKSPKIRFYLYSDEEQLATKISESNLREKGMNTFIMLVKDSDKVDNVLRLLGERPDMMNKGQKRLVIEDYALGNKREDGTGGIINMQKFLSVVEDKDLRLKGFIEECIIAQKLRRIPNTTTIVVSEDDSIVGNTIGEAVVYLRNPKNSKILSMLRAQMNYIDKSKEGSKKDSKETTDKK